MRIIATALGAIIAGTLGVLLWAGTGNAADRPTAPDADRDRAAVSLSRGTATSVPTPSGAGRDNDRDWDDHGGDRDDSDDRDDDGRWDDHGGVHPHPCPI